MNDSLIQAIIGGALIGIAGGALLLLKGRIMGVSGIVATSLKSPSVSGWRFWFLAGLALAPLILGYLNILSLPLSLPTKLNLELWQLAAGASLVGLGTSLGAGCTSGHGVCGIGRLSIRSVVATVVFMLVAMLTVYVIRHLLA